MYWIKKAVKTNLRKLRRKLVVHTMKYRGRLSCTECSDCIPKRPLVEKNGTTRHTLAFAFRRIHQLVNVCRDFTCIFVRSSLVIVIN